MRAFQLLPLVVLLTGAILIQPCHAQNGEGASATAVVPASLEHVPVETSSPLAHSLGEGGPKGALSPTSWAPAFGENPGRRAHAHQAAWMDPGILHYMEPPAGTDMPTYSGPENVDPEMVWPENQ